MVDKDKKSQENQKQESGNEDKPDEKIVPPRFFNLSEGVNPKYFSDKALKDKEKKNDK